jgi:hypothetical protein
MALHRTAVATAAAATLILLAGCDTLSARRLDFDNTEAVKITRITVRPGSSGDITVRTSGSASQVRIKRVLRYQGAQPTIRYEINGDELVLPMDCGSPRCSVSYEVTAPEGVVVRGEATSGNVELHRVGAVEFTMVSGNVSVTGASGDVHAKTSSGNVEVADATGALRLHTSSGDIEARRVVGAVDAEAGSGNVTVEFSEPASAQVRTGSGDIELTVPDGRYRVRTETGSGDTNLTVTNDPTASLLLDASTGSGNLTINRR